MDFTARHRNSRRAQMTNKMTLLPFGVNVDALVDMWMQDVIGKTWRSLVNENSWDATSWHVGWSTRGILMEDDRFCVWIELLWSDDHVFLTGRAHTKKFKDKSTYYKMFGEWIMPICPGTLFSLFINHLIYPPLSRALSLSTHLPTYPHMYFEVLLVALLY